MEQKVLPRRFECFNGFVKVWHEGNDVIFRGAPHLLVASAPATTATPREDCVIGLSYFELYATSHGVGTLWAGLLKWAIEDIAKELRTLLDIPAEHLIGGAMLFGNPTIRYYRTLPRDPEIVFTSTFDQN